MTLNRPIVLSVLAMLAMAACSREKVKPSDADTAAESDARARKAVQEYKTRQTAFADSVLQSASSTRQVVDKLGKAYEVGSLPMRDSLVQWVRRTPECYANGKALDPYLAGTVTFRIHMSVVGSDNVRVQESSWTTKAGGMVETCFNEAAAKWKFPMGMAKQGMYLLQVQFK